MNGAVLEAADRHHPPVLAGRLAAENREAEPALRGADEDPVVRLVTGSQRRAQHFVAVRPLAGERHRGYVFSPSVEGLLPPEVVADRVAPGGDRPHPL